MSLKIKIFLYLFKRNIILTKINLVKKGSHKIQSMFFFCDFEESTSFVCHLPNGKLNLTMDCEV
jgi:hypothetical protein